MQTFREPSKWLVWGIGIFVVLFVLSIIAIAMGPAPAGEPDPGAEERAAEDDEWWALLHDPAAPERIFVAGQRDLYQRRVADESWSSVHPEFAGVPFRDLARDADGETFYVAAPPGVGVIATSDGGRTWEFLNEDLPQNQPVTAVGAHPEEAGVLFAWLQQDGLYQRAGTEEAWTPVSEIDGQQLQVWGLVVIPADPLQLYAAATEGVWVSGDGGATWEEQTQLGGGAVAFGITHHHERPQRLLAATFGGLFRSDDGGETWSPLTVESSATGQFIDVDVHPHDPDRVMAVDSQNRVFASPDGGDSWERVW